MGFLSRVSKKQTLLPRTGAGWEGWFVIAVGRRDSHIRWAKTHLFRSRRSQSLVPIAAVENLRSEGELVTAIATGEEVFEQRLRVNPSEICSTTAGTNFSLEKPPHLYLSGRSVFCDGHPTCYRFEAEHPDESSRALVGRGSGGARADFQVSFRLVGTDRVQWIALPPLATYFGIHSDLEGTVKVGENSFPISGLGILEHAWGMRLPIDLNALMWGPWHWDVLSFERVDDREDVPGHVALAALWLPFGRRSIGVRALGRLPGGLQHTFSNVSVEYQDVKWMDDEAAGEPRRVPRRWVGRLRDHGGDLVYEAVASTPLYPAVDHGGFMGFDFHARYRPRGGMWQRLEGSGFTEFGGPLR